MALTSKKTPSRKAKTPKDRFTATVEEAAELTGIPIPTVYRWSRTGVIKRKQVERVTGGSRASTRKMWMVDPKEVLKVSEARREAQSLLTGRK
jgi:excisionase family DNA binding protein